MTLLQKRFVVFGWLIAGTLVGADADGGVMRPTHKQTAIMTVNPEGAEQAELKNFCLSPDGEILAACGVGEAGEVRRFSSGGDLLASWSLPVVPEAMSVGSDGFVYVAGGGRLLRLNLKGEVVANAEAPHVKKMLGDKQALREQVVASHKRSAEAYGKMLERYQDSLSTAEERLKEAEQQLAAAEEASEESPSTSPAADSDAAAGAESARAARLKKLVDARRQQRDAASRVFTEMKTLLGDPSESAELTEEQIEERVRDAIAYKSQVSSIAELNGQVFLTTGSPNGHGFAVWRASDQLADAETIVDGLRGCCGQMDVQACEDGLFVAENGRKRVCRYDLDGEMVTKWGKSAKSGVRGFGSCCNPMNVAFGPDASVYTAESSSGRIKKYDAQGKLLDLVGSVDLVPGCKKVSIAVSPSGDRVYMLDITRHHIVVMERLSEQERAELPGVEAGDDGSETDAISSSRNGVLQAFVGAIKTLSDRSKTKE